MKKKILSILLVLFIISISVLPLYAIDEDKGDNLALGKPVLATDQYSDSFKPTYVVDGNLNTAWASGPTMLNGLSGAWCYIMVDLGQIYNITSFTARSRRDTDQGYNRAGWYIHFSNDPNFQTFEEVGRKVEAGDYGSDLELSFEQEPKAYRYVRVAHEKRSNMVVSEIEVFGEPYMGEARVEFSDTEGKLTDSANILKTLGIMDAMEKTKFMPDLLVARMDALDTVLKAAGYSFGGESTMEERINYAEKTEIISSAQDFRPRDYVTVQEYKKMMLCAMGYGERIKMLGGWPVGVYNASKELGWTRAASQGEGDFASRETIANITYYALTSPVYSTGSLVGNFIERQKGDLLMERVFGLSLYEGVVTANGVTNLSEYSKKSSGYVEIDYKVFVDENAVIGEHVGKNVLYLVDINAENRIVDGFVSQEGNDFFEISMKRVISYADGTVKYFEEDENENEFDLAEECSFIKNGVAKNDITEDEFKKENGKILFVDNDKDGYIDVVLLNTPTVAVADYCVDDGKTVSFMGMDGTRVDATYDTISYYRNGRRVLAEQMSRNSLVYVYVSENEKVVRFECFTNKIKGTVDGISDKYISLEGTQYDMSEYFAKNERDKVTVGTVGVFVFDDAMRIVAVVDSDDLFFGERYGVILGRNQQGLAAGQIRLFTQDDEIATLTESDKLTIDGTKIANVDFSRFVGEIVIFKTNIADELTEIHTKYGSVPRIVENNVDIANAWYYGNSIFESEKESAHMLFPVDKNATVFTLPFIDGVLATGKTYEGSYSADIFANVIRNGNNGRLTYYNVDDFMTPQIIVKKVSVSNASVGLISSAGPEIYMVESVGEAYENDEFYTLLELVNVLTGEKSDYIYSSDYDKIIMYDRMLVDGLLRTETRRIPETEMTDEGKAALDQYSIPITSLKKGDIIRGQLESSNSNKFLAVDRIYTPSDFVKDVSYISYGENAPNANAYFMLRCGTLKAIKEGKLQIEVSSDGKFYTSIYGDAKKLIVFDGDIHVCSARELPAYVDSDSEIVILSGQGKDNAIFIYNN